MGETLQETMERLTSLVSLYPIVFSRSFVLKKIKTPVDKTLHNPDSQSSPRLCIYLLSQTANHLESVPIFNQRLETGVVLRAEPFSLAF